MDPHLKDVLFFLQDPNPEMVRLLVDSFDKQVNAWDVVFRTYVDVWGSGLTESEEEEIKKHFKVGHSAETDPVSDAFIFPSTATCSPVSETFADMLFFQQFACEIAVREFVLLALTSRECKSELLKITMANYSLEKPS